MACKLVAYAITDDGVYRIARAASVHDMRLAKHPDPYVRAWHRIGLLHSLHREIRARHREP